MKKHLKQILIVLCLFAAPLGMYAQSLMFHLAGGAKTTVTLPATFTVTPSGDKLVIAFTYGDNIQLAKDEIMCVTYRDAPGDVNGDMRVDVADVSSLVGLLVGKDVVEPKLTCSDEHHPHLIDLGLPSGTKWACCNVGASKPEDYGGYYAWGETEEKDSYDLYSYNSQGVDSDIAGTDNDVAHVVLGDSWTIPSLNQIEELIKNTTTKWTMQNGVNGLIFTGKNGGTIFLPAAGLRNDEFDFGYVGTYGLYWSSLLFEGDLDSASALDFGSDNTPFCYSSYARYYGLSVRPVRKN